MKTTETWDCASVKLSARDQYTVFRLEPFACDAFYVTVFARPH